MRITQPVLYLALEAHVHERCKRDAAKNGFTAHCVTSSPVEAKAFLQTASELPPLVFLIPSRDAAADVEVWSDLVKTEIRSRGAWVTVVTV